MRATDPPAPTPRAPAPTTTVPARAAATAAVATASTTPAPPIVPRVPAVPTPAIAPITPTPPVAPTAPTAPVAPTTPAPSPAPSAPVVELQPTTRRVPRADRARTALASILVIRPWPDPLLDRVGHDPSAEYVERFWLPILGPSGLLLLRRLVTTVETGGVPPSAPVAGTRTGGTVDEPAIPTIAVADLAAALGMGSPRGPSGAFYRTLDRLLSFGFAHLVDDATLAVRTHLPPLTRRQLKRLPAAVRDEHEQWMTEQAETPGVTTEHLTRRARALALSLLELGEDRAGAERQLHRWQFHPAIAHDAIRWAVAEHQRRQPPPPVPA